MAGTLTAGVGTVPVSSAVLGNDFEDRITPIAPAIAIFTDDSGAANGLSFSGAYKVVFLRSRSSRTARRRRRRTSMNRVKTFFGP